MYKHFRNEFALYGDVFKPTGMNKNVEYVSRSKRHDFIWQSLDNQLNMTYSKLKFNVSMY